MVSNRIATFATQAGQGQQINRPELSAKKLIHSSAVNSELSHLDASEILLVKGCKSCVISH